MTDRSGAIFAGIWSRLRAIYRRHFHRTQAAEARITEARPAGTDGMHAEKVLADDDEELKALRTWAWFAVKHAGGKVVVSYDEFFTCQGDATLYWRIDPQTFSLTIVAE